MDLPSSMVITPSFPTFSIASAISSPTASSEAEIAAIWAISCLPEMGLLMSFSPSTASFTAASMPLRSTMGLAPAATFFIPSRTIAWASRVAVVVPSPATSLVLEATSRTSCAPIFSNGSSSSISLAMVTPSLVIKGLPYCFSSTTLQPLGPRVILTVFARVSRPLSSALRASSPCKSCFAILFCLLS